MTTKRAIFPDPERCPVCGIRGRIVESRRGLGYRKRRRQCPTCAVTWTSYESRINVQRAIARKRREILRPDPPDAGGGPVVPPYAAPAPPAEPGVRPPARQPRVGRSRYLTR